MPVGVEERERLQERAQKISGGSRRALVGQPWLIGKFGSGHEMMEKAGQMLNISLVPTCTSVRLSWAHEKELGIGHSWNSLITFS